MRKHDPVEAGEKVPEGIRFRTSDNFIYRKVAGTGVLISVGENVADFNGFVQLNDTAECIWEKLAEPSDEASLVTAVTERYDVPPEEAEMDVREFLAELMKRHMVERAD